MRMMVTSKLYPLVAAAPPKIVGLMVSISVSTAPISTTNITGLRHIQRGSSLITDCQRAGIRMSVLKVALRCREVVVMWVTASGKCQSGPHGEVLSQRAKRQDREEGQRANDEHGASEHATKETTIGAHRANCHRHFPLGGHRAGQRQHEHDRHVASERDDYSTTRV